MTLELYVMVGLGGFLGAPCRYLLDRAINRRWEPDLPWGTFMVNVSGSLVLGLITGLSLSHHLSEVAKSLVGTGFCGAFTTFSTFTFETVRLIEVGQVLEASLNVVASVLVGLAGAALGLWLGLSL